MSRANEALFNYKLLCHKSSVYLKIVSYISKYYIDFLGYNSLTKISARQ